MITDQQTNFVYFSGRLPYRHPGLFKKLKVALRLKGVPYGLLPHTSDIWCRDYMPIQAASGRFIQFNYNPRYLQSKQSRRTITDTAKVCKAIGIKPIVSDIKLDGGNVVASRTRVIMTERVLLENPSYSAEKLTKELKRLLKVKEVILIPECPCDEFGHADGMVRFLDEDTIFVNEYSLDIDLKEKLHSVLGKAGLAILPVPYHPYENDDSLDATGIYINYLRLKKAFLYPVYGLHEDALARETFSGCFGARAVPIDAGKLAKEGGILNCISWNILKGGNIW